MKTCEIQKMQGKKMPSQSISHLTECGNYHKFSLQGSFIALKKIKRLCTHINKYYHTLPYLLLVLLKTHSPFLKKPLCFSQGSAFLHPSTH